MEPNSKGLGIEPFSVRRRFFWEVEVTRETHQRGPRERERINNAIESRVVEMSSIALWGGKLVRWIRGSLFGHLSLTQLFLLSLTSNRDFSFHLSPSSSLSLSIQAFLSHTSMACLYCTAKRLSELLSFPLSLISNSFLLPFSRLLLRKPRILEHGMAGLLVRKAQLFHKVYYSA